MASAHTRMLGAAVLLIGVVFGQTAPAFDAASIKPSSAEPGSGSAVSNDTGRIHGVNATLKRYIRSAYDLPESQIFGGPKWAEEERYDIDAKATGPAGSGELMAMMQSLLATRFQLVVHRETRLLAGYALVPGKGPMKASASAPEAKSRSDSTRKSIDAVGCGMARLAQKLSEVLHVPVSDGTGIEGRFDFHLEWTPEDMQTKAGNEAAVPGLTLFAALQEQLGLKLEARKVPTEVMVIDRAEKPAAN